MPASSITGIALMFKEFMRATPVIELNLDKVQRRRLMAEPAPANSRAIVCLRWMYARIDAMY
ncbi:MAG TPA: hypothetical protein VJX74_06750 [Blastocatellia bacterium]|nr:hypothetical protein [Blastocatellia bacterium]